jgi:hypothetical protein
MQGLTLWQKFKHRNKGVLVEVTRTQLELANEDPKRSNSASRRRRVSVTMICFFWIILTLIAILAWSLLKSGRSVP